MEITQAAWNNYTDTQKAIRKKAAEEMKKYIEKYGFENRDALIEFANELTNKYGEAAAAYACDLFEEIAAAQGIIVNAEVAEVLSYGEVAKAVNGSLKQSPNGQLLTGVIERVVKQAAADTMLANTKRYNASYAWVPSGTTCTYCLMLGAMGWQDAVNIKGKHAEHIHANCDCEFVIDFKGDMKVPGYDPDAITEKLFNLSSDKGTEYDDAEQWLFEYFLRYNGRKADRGRMENFNEIRRIQYAQNKDRINAQKRAAYAARKAAEEGN